MIVKIRLERIKMQSKITVEALLDSKVTELVMSLSLKFAKKQKEERERRIEKAEKGKDNGNKKVAEEWEI